MGEDGRDTFESMGAFDSALTDGADVALRAEAEGC